MFWHIEIFLASQQNYWIIWKSNNRFIENENEYLRKFLTTKKSILK